MLSALKMGNGQAGEGAGKGRGLSVGQKVLSLVGLTIVMMIVVATVGIVHRGRRHLPQEPPERLPRKGEHMLRKLIPATAIATSVGEP